MHKYFYYDAVNINKMNFLHYYQKTKLTAITIKNIFNA